MDEREKKKGALAQKVTAGIVSVLVIGTCAAAAATVTRFNAEYGTETETKAVTTASVSVSQTVTESAATVSVTESTLFPSTTQPAETTSTTAAVTTTSPKTTAAIKTTAKPTTTAKPKTTAKPAVTTKKPTTKAPAAKKDATVKVTVADSSGRALKTFNMKVPDGTRMNTLYLRDRLKEFGYNSSGEFSGDAFFAVAESGKTYSLTAYVQ